MKTLEDKSTDLSVKKMCVCVGRVQVCMYRCVFCECQNKETVQWIFYSTTPLPICTASQCWPLEHAGMLVHARTHTHTHTRTNLFSQEAQLSAARVPFAQVPCWCDHRADTPSIRVWSRAVHLPALFWAWVQTLDTRGSRVNGIPAGMSHQHENQWFTVNRQSVILLVVFAFHESSQSEDVQCFCIHLI